MTSSPIDQGGQLPDLAAVGLGQATGNRRRFGRILDRIGLYLRGAVENPTWILIFTLGRFVRIRRLLRAVSRWSGHAAETRSRLFDGVAIEATVETLEREGICLGIQLPEATVAEIRDFARTHACYGVFDRDFAFLADRHAAAEEKFGRRFLIGHFLDQVEACPAIQAIQDDPVLKEIAARYLRADHIPISTRLWWSFPSSEALDSELRLAAQDRVHADINDWRSVKFFFYLTDVDQDAGAHIFIRRTHRQRLLRHQFTLFTGHTLEALLGAYGKDSLMTVCGKAGFGFAEDPFAFHSGTIVKRTPRLILQVEYGVTPVSRARFYGA
jgi:hypothetical protein